MKNAIIFHGTNFESDDGLSHTNWFQWLKLELEKRGYETFVPDLPFCQSPDADIYWDFIKDFNFNEETILVGHSSGATFVLRALEKLAPSTKVAQSILVAGFSQDQGWNCEGLFKTPFDWNKIKKSSHKIIQIHSKNDPYVSIENAKGLADNLGIELTLIPDSGHFNTGSNPKFTKFPELLDILKTKL